MIGVLGMNFMIPQRHPSVAKALGAPLCCRIFEGQNTYHIFDITTKLYISSFYISNP
jgi:hypothetical protein